MDNPLQRRIIPRWQSPVDPLRDIFLLAGRLFPSLYDIYLHRFHGRPDPWIYLIYSNGHSATSSLYSSLVAHGFRPALQLHMLNPQRIAGIPHYPRGVPMMYHRMLIGRRRKLKIISVVRNPVDLHISGFFREMSHAGLYDPAMSMDRVTELFGERYSSVPEDWFTVELNPVLGIDLYSYPYRAEDRSLRIETGWFDLLVVRLEMDEQERNHRVASFLGTDKFSWDRDTNAARGKDYYPLYRQFRDRAQICPEVLNRLLAVRYAGHFYTAGELEDLRGRWSAPGRPVRESR